MTCLFLGLRDDHHPHPGLPGRLDQRADLDGSRPVRDVLDLALLPEEVVGELRLQRIDHPPGEAVAQKGQNRGEGFLGGQGAATDGMDMRPVDQGPHKREFTGQEGDVAEGTEGVLLAGSFQTEGDAQVLHLGGQVMETSPHQIEQFRTAPPVLVARMGADDARTESLAQFHGVFESSQALFGPVFLLDGQNREVGSVDGDVEISLGGQLAEGNATLLLPGEVLDKGQLDGLVAASNKVVEKRLVVIARW